MKPLRVLAAGSLRPVWPTIIRHFQTAFPAGIETEFGPAGLLRQRIERGDECDLFASANMAHPLSLQQKGLALKVAAFCQNSLCLTVHPSLGERSWLQLLQDPTLRIATSTAGSDPCGDYARQLFDRLTEWDRPLGESLKQRAQMLVGGPYSPAVPSGMQAACWLITSGQTDLFIGYHSYARQGTLTGSIATVQIPAEWQPPVVYGFAVCRPAAEELGHFLLSEEAQAIFCRAGFHASAS